VSASGDARLHFVDGSTIQIACACGDHALISPPDPGNGANCMLRREFLARSSRVVLGGAFVPWSEPLLRGARRFPRGDHSFDLAALVDRLNAQVPHWMRESSVPGVGICIVDAAQIAWRGSFGVEDATSRKTVTEDTMFEAASMSKPAFAYVVMKLAETGAISLDTPLTRYTSQKFLTGDRRLEQITARHILSHTSGFQNWRTDAAPLRIHFAPGERYMYSGEGYNYLQTVMSELLRQPFESFMAERLLQPLGMTSSGYVWNDMLGARMSRPHDAQGRALRNTRSTAGDVARYGAAGALLTTPSDYARFVIGVIDPPTPDRFRLTRASVAEMLRPHVKLEGESRYPASWALGWQVFHNRDRDFIFHGGDNTGFHCLAVASTAGKSGLVIMTNGEQGTALLPKVLTDERTQAFLAK
jgi:CubicO group peptidase (beta-lactamase class C family)